MRKVSRRQKENSSKIENFIYSNLTDAIATLKKTANAKFIESIEFHANLNIDPKYADQQLRTTITLPNGIGKDIKIAALVNENNIKEAKEGQADLIGNNDLIEEINKGCLLYTSDAADD